MEHQDGSPRPPDISPMPMNNRSADSSTSPSHGTPLQQPALQPPQSDSAQKRRRRRRTKAGDWEDPEDEPKRRVVSTACVACRKRKSKCDGNTPACAACSQVYNTACVYDPNSDHRRKGVYRQDNDTPKTREDTLQTLIHTIQNATEEEASALVRRIRATTDLDSIAESITPRNGLVLPKIEPEDDDDDEISPGDDKVPGPASFEVKLGAKMGELRLDDGSLQFIGGTSHLLFLNPAITTGVDDAQVDAGMYQHLQEPILSWTEVTSDPELITHLLNLYFTWHYSYFTCLSRPLFYRSFIRGHQPVSPGQPPEHCSPLLVNAMLALGCHFTSRPAARADPNDATTAGDHFFREAKRLILEFDEHEKPRITTVQALALMSVREAGCGRESRGWVYSGMSFRMACDLGLHLDSGTMAATRSRPIDPDEEDSRRITFWGCFLFDKCWSNYLGRLPQLSVNLVTCPKFEVFPDEDSAEWIPYGDAGAGAAHRQPARTRAVALQISGLCEISSDLMRFFYNPGAQAEISGVRGKQLELKKLSEIEIRLERWRKNLPKEMEPRDGALSSVFIMHMFYQLLFIHLFRPFLKYTASTSPLPPTVSPRKVCTSAATAISRLARLYKRTYGLRQICNICVYMIHTACTIHLLNLPDRDARRDIVHSVRQLEEIAESWPCARRTLGILETLARQWRVNLPPDASAVLEQCGLKFAGPEGRKNSSPAALQHSHSAGATAHLPQQQHQMHLHQNQHHQASNLHPHQPSQTQQPQQHHAMQQPQQQQHQQQQQQQIFHDQQLRQTQQFQQPFDQSQITWPQTSMPVYSTSSISHHSQQQPAFPHRNMLDPSAQQQRRSSPSIFGGVDQLLQEVGGARPSLPPNPNPRPLQQQQQQQQPQQLPQQPMMQPEAATFSSPPPSQTPDWTLADQRDLAWGLGNWDFTSGAGAAGGAGGVATAGATPGSGTESLMEGFDIYGGYEGGFGGGGG